MAMIPVDVSLPIYHQEAEEKILCLLFFLFHKKRVGQKSVIR